MNQTPVITQAHFDKATRSFAIKVTGCKNCPEADKKQSYLIECSRAGTIALAQKLGHENYSAITPNCPMHG